MHGAVARNWLEWNSAAGSRRIELGETALRLGADGTELATLTAAGGWLELSGSPPRLVLRGGGAAPRVNAREVREIALAHGDRIEWQGAVMVFHSEAPAAGLQELPAHVAAATELDVQVAARLQAGLLCELDLVDRAVARRWQDAVVAGAFDPDAAARELLGAARAAAGDPRLRERSARLQRDLLMAPLQRGLRGAARRARSGTRSIAAALLTQALVVLTLAVLFAVALSIARLRWGISLDAWLDRVLALLP